MSQTSLRLRVVPRYPAKVTATDGLKAVRSGVDLVVKSDYGNLVQVPTVTNPDKTFMLAWDSDIDNYQSMSFTNIINNIQDAVIGPPLAAIDATNPGANQVVYFTDVGQAATYTASDFVRSISNAVDAESFREAINAASHVDVPIYDTIDGMSALTVPASIGAIRVNAKSSPDDRLGGFYIDINNGSTDTFVSGGDTARTWYRSSADRALGRRAFAGTNIYPNDVPGASSRYDPNSSFKANTVGAKNLLLGAAAKDGGTWVEAYMPGDDAVGRALHYAIADGHGYTMVNALRSSDFVSAVRDFLITDVTVMVADHQTVAHTLWNRYDHGIITATGLFAQFYNEEKSLQNLAANAGSLDPFTAAVGGDRTRVAVNLHLTSGINAGSPSNLLSAAIDVSANGGRYRRGIVVAADALDTTSGTADAIAMAINHSLTWYVSDGAGAGKAVWKLFNNSGSGTLSQIILGTNNLWVAAADIAVTSGRKLGLVPDASIGFRFNAGNGHVELVRTDGTVIAFWVV